MIGQQIAQFRVQEKIGEGGMGVVYKALDTKLNRLVALKVLPPDRATNRDDRARLLQEARAASALNHPNIITIYDICTHEGNDVIVMEYIAGRTLDQAIPKKGLRVSEILRISIPIADALATAHAASITHRDLKPANVMLGESGIVKLLDFGLARLPEVAFISSDEPTVRRPRTEEGSIAGTVSYMSPEQAQGKRDLDSRSDVFSFGAMLFEMATGLRAFPGDSGVSTLAAILRDDPPPVRQITSDVPRDLEKVITRCLRKDPRRRFQHMGDAALSLIELKEEMDSGVQHAAMPAPSRRASVWPWLVAVLCALTFAGLETRRRFFDRPSGSPLPMQLTTYPGDERQPSLSPDGNQVAFAWNGPNQDNEDVYVKLIGSSGAPLRLTSNELPDRWPSWSPNGQWVAFLRRLNPQRLGVFVVAPLGGGERKLFEIASFRQNHETRPSWTADSKWLLVPDREGDAPTQSLYLFSFDTGTRRRITTQGEQDGDDYGASMAPDGKKLVFVRGNAAAATRLMSLDLSGDYQPNGQPKELLSGVNIRNTAISPSGDVLFSSGLVLPRGLFRLPSGSLGVPERLAGLQDTTQGVTSAGSRLIYSVRHRDVDISRIDLKAAATPSVPEKLISSTLPDDYPKYSPDGKRIVFRSVRSGNPELWVSDAGGHNPVQLTTLAGPLVSLPSWSPDGKTIGFWVVRDTQGEICTVPSDGGPLNCPVVDKHLVSGPTFSSDGRWMYFTSSRSGSSQIWKSLLDGTSPQPVTRLGGAYVLGIKNDVLYYEKNDSLWKASLSQASESLMLPGVFVRNSVIATNGIYVSPPGSRVLRYLNFSTGAVNDAITLEQPMSAGVSLSADERYLILTQMESRGSDLMMIENAR